MRKIALSHSLLFYLDELDFSEAALSADPDAAPFAVPFTEAITEWDAIFKQERLARRNVIRAEAGVAVANERFDAVVLQFAALARATARELLERCFRIAPGKFVRRNLRVQADSTKNVIVPEIASLAQDHPCKSFGPKLHSLADSALQSLDARAQVKGKSTAAANDSLEWKEGINALRTTTYAELLKIATDKGYPKSWVESFFRQSHDDNDDDSAPSSSSTPTVP